jgi:hypothetical protein
MKHLQIYTIDGAALHLVTCTETQVPPEGWELALDRVRLHARSRPSRSSGQCQDRTNENSGFQIRQSPHVDNSSFPPELLKFMKGL